MKFPRFDMERMQSVWEHKVKYDLSESGVEALTLDEITRDPKELLKTRLGYAEGVGREATRARKSSACANRTTRPDRSSRRPRCRASFASRIAKVYGSCPTRSIAEPSAPRRRARRSAAGASASS